jgi:hypothetical protein
MLIFKHANKVATICAERLASGVRRNRDLVLLALLAAFL